MEVGSFLIWGKERNDKLIIVHAQFLKIEDYIVRCKKIVVSQENLTDISFSENA